MEIALPLDEMTVEEKIRMIELIWDDLCRGARSGSLAGLACADPK